MKTKFQKTRKIERKQKQLIRKQKNIETMKTRINQVAVAAIFTLLFIGGNSYAKGTELIASSMKTIVEPALEMENWMTDDATWNKANTAYVFEEATEGSLVLESWMTNENTWANFGVGNFENEVESSLVLESWMTNEEFWQTESFTFSETENDNDLVLESWMVNDKTWNIQ